MPVSRFAFRSITPRRLFLTGALAGLAWLNLAEPGLAQDSTFQSLAQAEATAANKAAQAITEPTGEAAPDEAEAPTTAAENAQSAASLTLERPDTDPLLPGQTNGRDLAAQEQTRLRLGLERLEREANGAYRQGDRPQAYRKFFRILSLSQYLPVEEELSRLTRVGRRAWEDSQAEEVQAISARVRALELESGEKTTLLRRQALAEAYDSLGAWNAAIAQYEILLAVEQPDGVKGSTGVGAVGSGDSSSTSSGNLAISPGQVSPLEEITLINRLAQLSLFSLDYPAAALYTEQAIQLASQTEATAARPGATNVPDLLAIAVPGANLSETNEAVDPTLELPLPSEIGPAQTSTTLLVQLAYVYEQDRRFAEAAAVQQQILPLYEGPVLVQQQPALQVAIARNQARSGQLVEAIATYQTAYSQSQTLQQFAVSKVALSQLAELYRNQDQLEDALAVYDVLLQVNDLSYDLYGVADTQANRAEILVSQQQLEAARRAYRQALYAAKLLGYREAEFQQRLNDLPSS